MFENNAMLYNERKFPVSFEIEDPAERLNNIREVLKMQTQKKEM